MHCVFVFEGGKLLFKYWFNSLLTETHPIITKMCTHNIYYSCVLKRTSVVCKMLMKYLNSERQKKIFVLINEVITSCLFLTPCFKCRWNCKYLFLGIKKLSISLGMWLWSLSCDASGLFLTKPIKYFKLSAASKTSS